MRLEHLHIQHFHGLQDVEFDLEPATVLVGANNAGKSTILDALNLLFGRPDRFGSDFIDILYHHARVTARFGDLTAKEMSDWSDWVEAGSVTLGGRVDAAGAGLPMVLASLDDQRAQQRTGWLVTEEAGLGWYRPMRRVGQGFDVSLPIPALVTLRGPEVGPPDVGALLEPLVAARFLDLFPEQLDEVLRELVRKVLDPFARGLSRLVPGYLEGVSRVEISTNYSLAYPGKESSVLQEPLLGRLSFSVLEDIEPDEDAPETALQLSELLRQLGGGAQRAFALAALELYADRELLPDRHVILAIEEPEVGLHLGAQRRVAEALARIPTYGVQTLIVTHSPTFVDAAPLAGLRLVRAVKEGHGSTRREVLVPRDLAEIADSLGAMPSDILLGDRFVVVEGASDGAVLKTWARLRGWDLDAARVKVYPAGGWARVHGLAAFVQVAFDGARFFVLLDNGSDTAKEALEMRAAFGERVDVTLLSRSEVEAYFPPDAVSAWLELQGAEEVAVNEAERTMADQGVRKKVLRAIAKRALEREYRVVEDGVAIAGLMPEAAVPSEVMDLLMRVTSR